MRDEYEAGVWGTVDMSLGFSIDGTLTLEIKA